MKVLVFLELRCSSGDSSRLAKTAVTAWSWCRPQMTLEEFPADPHAKTKLFQMFQSKSPRITKVNTHNLCDPSSSDVKLWQALHQTPKLEWYWVWVAVVLRPI